MKLDLLILAIAPVATIILWIYLKDKYDKEPIRVLSKFFILGILVSTLAIYAEEILIKTNIFTGKSWRRIKRVSTYTQFAKRKKL